MDTLQIDIVRGFRPGLQLRAETTDGGMPTMVGHFSVFNRWYEVYSWFEGEFLEQIAPGAFRETFAAHWDADDDHRIKVLYSHGHDYSIGDKVLGPSRVLREDKTGPYYEVPLFNTSYNADLVPGIEEGEYGSSFRFRVKEEHWVDEPGINDHNPKGLPERTILNTATFEYGPCTFGANPAATAGVRSLTDDYYEAMRMRSPSLFEEACRAVGREIPTGRAVARSTAGGGSEGEEPDPGDEPTEDARAVEAADDERTTPIRVPAEVRHRDLLLRGVIQ